MTLQSQACNVLYMNTPYTAPIIATYPARRGARGFLPASATLSAVPAVGSLVFVMSARGHAMGEGVVVENAWAKRDANPLARLRSLQTCFRVESLATETRSWNGQTWTQPLYIFDVDYRLDAPTNIYDTSATEALAMLPAYLVKDGDAAYWAGR